MKLNRVVQTALLLSLLLNSTGTLLAPEAQANIYPENYMLVGTEEAEAGQAVKSLNARITIDAPPVYVWQTLTNYPKLKEFMPGYRKTDVISSDSNCKVLDVAMSPSRLLPGYNYKVRVNENKKSYVLNFHQISGDFKYLSASYQLLPKGNGSKTILVYNLKIDAGNRLPQFGLNTILKNNAEKTLKAIQSRSETDHKKSLIGQR